MARPWVVKNMAYQKYQKVKSKPSTASLAGPPNTGITRGSSLPGRVPTGQAPGLTHLLLLLLQDVAPRRSSGGFGENGETVDLTKVSRVNVSHSAQASLFPGKRLGAEAPFVHTLLSTPRLASRHLALWSTGEMLPPCPLRTVLLVSPSKFICGYLIPSVMAFAGGAFER